MTNSQIIEQLRTANTHQEVLSIIYEDLSKTVPLSSLTIELNTLTPILIENLWYIPGKSRKVKSKTYLGRIWIISKQEARMPWYDQFAQYNLYTGTGGYGLYDHPKYFLHEKGLYPYSYDLTYHEIDFPGITLWKAINPNKENDPETTLIHVGETYEPNAKKGLRASA